MATPSRFAALLAAALLAPSALPAQPTPYEAQELAPGVIAMIQTPRARVADSNVLVIINAEDVVVVDANILPSSTRHIIAEIRRRTNKPVRYVINTHWHSDHHYGNAAYQAAFPGVEFIQHINTRRDVIERDVPALRRNIESDYPAVVSRLRTALETGKTSGGAVVTDSLRAEFASLLELYQTFLTDMQDVNLIPGSLVFSDSVVLHRGARRIVVKHLGRGNTAGDLVVHLPDERIVATGDLVVHPTPFGFFSYLGDWPTTLRALKELDAAFIVPGHGTVQQNWHYAERLIELIECVWTQVHAAVAAGADLEAVRKSVDVAKFRIEFAGSDPVLQRAFDMSFVQPAIEAAFNELRPGVVKIRL